MTQDFPTQPDNFTAGNLAKRLQPPGIFYATS